MMQLDAIGLTRQRRVKSLWLDLTAIYEYMGAIPDWNRVSRIVSGRFEIGLVSDSLKVKRSDVWCGKDGDQEISTGDWQ